MIQYTRECSVTTGGPVQFNDSDQI